MVKKHLDNILIWGLAGAVAVGMVGLFLIFRRRIDADIGTYYGLSVDQVKSTADYWFRSGKIASTVYREFGNMKETRGILFKDGSALYYKYLESKDGKTAEFYIFPDIKEITYSSKSDIPYSLGLTTKPEFTLDGNIY